MTILYYYYLLTDGATGFDHLECHVIQCGRGLGAFLGGLCFGLVFPAFCAGFETCAWRAYDRDPARYACLGRWLSCKRVR